MIKIQIKKLRPDAVLPTRGSEYAAGYDLYACTGKGSVTIAPHTTEMIGTGLSLAVPEGYFGAIFARSGLASKQGLRPANCVGVCDSDYRGEYITPLHNDSDSEKVVHDGDRIAQLVVLPYLDVSFDECEELSETARGDGGFGSTGR
jgi:dUTP pyrophosphatase